VVPVYNSEGTLEELVSRLEPVLKGLSETYELVLVNDGSHDSSWSVIVDLSRRHPWVRGFNLMRNYGQHNALLCGVRAAKYDTTVTIDDDLQNPPEEIPKVLTKFREGYDVVYAPPEEETHDFLRNLASKLTKLAFRSALGVKMAHNISAFRVFRTKLRDAFATYHGPFVSMDVLLAWGAVKITALPVRQDSRKFARSNYTFQKLLAHALNMMTGFSAKPLQFASLMGFSFTLLGLVALAFVVIRYIIVGESVPGFPFLASIISIFSGVQLFVLGIIGEYLARMHFRMMDQPPYVIDSTSEPTGDSSGQDA